MTTTAGCGGTDLTDQLSGDAFDRETAVFSRIGALDFAAVARAYQRMDSLSYRLDTETRQMSEGGRTLASESRRVRIGPGTITVERVTAHGEMAEGFMTFATAPDSIPDQSHRLVELWVPAAPAYVSPRNREYYRYSQAPDTVVASEPCHVFAVEALAGVPPDKMPIRSARLAVARADSALLWLRMTRQDDALFYRESSILTLRMRRSADAQIVPATRDVFVSVEAPLRSPHYFASTQNYGFEQAPDGGD